MAAVKKLRARFPLTLVLVNSLGELVDGGWNLKTLEKNAFLSLNADVFGPFDETGEVTDGLDITTDSEVFRRLLEQRVFLFRASFTSDGHFSLSSFLYLILNHR